MKTPLHQKRVRFYFAGANIAYFVGFSKFFAAKPCSAGGKNDGRWLQHSFAALRARDSGLRRYRVFLQCSRPTEALEYGSSVYKAAKLYLPGTLELIYAEELMGNCFYAVGEVDEAKELFTEALRGIETEISEAEVLRDGIKKKLR